MLILKLTFENPLLLGQTESSDILNLQFIKPALFKDRKFKKSLSRHSLKLSVKLLKQAVDSPNTKAF